MDKFVYATKVFLANFYLALCFVRDKIIIINLNIVNPIPEQSTAMSSNSVERKAYIVLRSYQRLPVQA